MADIGMNRISQGAMFVNRFIKVKDFLGIYIHKSSHHSKK